MKNKEQKMIEVNQALLNNPVLVDVTEFIPFLRMTGFGLGCWSYSTEQLKDRATKNNIKRSLKQFNLNFSDFESDYITGLLIHHSFSFSDSELTSLKKYGTNSLASRIESKSKNMDYVIEKNINPKYGEAANVGFMDESINDLCSRLYSNGAFLLESSGASANIGSIDILKSILSLNTIYNVKWEKPYVTFSCGLDVADRINTSLLNSTELNFKWGLEFKFLPSKKLSWTIQINDSRITNLAHLTKHKVMNLKKMMNDDLVSLSAIL